MIQKLKNNKMYIITFVICLTIMILCALQETNIFYIVRNFIFNAEYRENFSLAESNIKTSVNIFQVIKQVIMNYNWKFDYILVFGTNLFQLILPCMISISGIVFYNKYNSIYNFSIHKEKNYKTFLIKEIYGESVKISISTFLAFLTFYFIVLIMTKGSLSEYMGRTLFLDIFGQVFYSKFTYLYYILDGAVRFFLVPFVYTFMSCTLATLLKNQKQVFFISNIYYYGLSVIGFGLYYLIGKWAIYINPSVIMASGSYDNVNSILLIFVTIMPLIVSYLYVKYNRNAIEL